MSIELHRFDNLGHKDELKFVLFKGLNPKEDVVKENFIRFCGSNYFSLNLSITGVLALLEFIDFIELRDGKIRVIDSVFHPENFDSDSYFENSHFYNQLFEVLKKEGLFEILFSNQSIQIDQDTARYFIKNHLIPIKYYSVRNLLLSLGFLKQNQLIKDHLVIPETFTTIFEKHIEARKSKKKKRTKDDLDKSLELREKLGLEAEIFVLSHEKERLKNHPFANAIKRVSDEDVSAGYDIESFSDSSSVFPNRFIEVKSYSESISFFWSRNEVEKAKSLREEYYLYLVDRSKLAEKDYKPKILQDPWSKIMKSEYWLKDAESWKIEYSEL